MKKINSSTWEPKSGGSVGYTAPKTKNKTKQKIWGYSSSGRELA
jgi:hypothetical protein